MPAIELGGTGIQLPLTPLIQVIFVRKLGQAPQPAPNPFGRTTFQIDSTVDMREDHVSVTKRLFLRLATAGILCYRVPFEGATFIYKRAQVAIWAAARADGRTEIHDCLRVSGNVLLGRVFVSQRPKLS